MWRRHASHATLEARMTDTVAPRASAIPGRSCAITSGGTRIRSSRSASRRSGCARVNLDYLDPGRGRRAGLGGRPGHAGGATGRGGPVPAPLTDPRPSRATGSLGAPDHPRSMRRIRMLRPRDTPSASASRSAGCGGSVSTLLGKAGRSDGSAPRCPTPGRWRCRPATTTSPRTLAVHDTSARPGTRPMRVPRGWDGERSCCISSPRRTGRRSG